MDRDEALGLLTGGREQILKWNDYLLNDRRTNVRCPDLAGADLAGADIRGAQLSGADLRLFGANLSGANLAGVNFTRADLSGTNLGDANLVGAALSGTNLAGARLIGADLSGTDLLGANFIGANLSGANLSGARLSQADLTGADLSDADLTGVDLSWTNLRGANLRGAELRGSHSYMTIFIDVDLSQVRGLDEVVHDGPSSIGVDTIFRSEGKIPDSFLQGCGVAEALIVQLPALIGAMNPIQFYSCFISHSSADKEFARRLHSRMTQENMRVWFDEIDMQSGKKLHEQIDEAIRVFDRLLLVLSPNSMSSEWVKTEIRKAYKIEKREGKRKLFPIGLASFSSVREWECFDADHGLDLAVEVRQYYIPDFSAWKDNDSFEAAFERLLRDLKSEAPVNRD